MTVNLQNSPYLPRQRNFPNDSAQALGVVLDKTYIEIAIKVNEKTIGLFSVNLPSITGESWYFQGQPKKQQTLRQVYPFGAIVAGATLNIPYTAIGFAQFSKIYGTCITSLPDNRPIPYASVAANSNIDVRVDATNIIISVGAGSPNIVSGIIILEWLTTVQNNNP